MGLFDTVTLGDVGAAAVGGVAGAILVDTMMPGASNLYLGAGAIAGAGAGIGVKKGAEKAYDWAMQEDPQQKAALSQLDALTRAIDENTRTVQEGLRAMGQQAAPGSATEAARRSLG